MMNRWIEFVHIRFVEFKAGEYPWTREEFYRCSLPQDQSPYLVDPICLYMSSFGTTPPNDLWAPMCLGEIRIADGIEEWWNESSDVWSVYPIPLDDNLRLTEDVIRMTFIPITNGIFDREDAHSLGLMESNIREMSCSDVFDDIPPLMGIFEKYRKGHSELRILTAWQCEAGHEYIPGEPDEYDENWWVMGAVVVNGDSISIEKLS